MGKPNLTIRTEQQLMDKLKQRAEADELSISEVANIAIAAYLGEPMDKTIPAQIAELKGEIRSLKESLAGLGKK